MTASFYDEGRDDGMAKNSRRYLKKSNLENDKICKDSEDFIGFIFYAMSLLLREESNSEVFLSNILFVDIINNL